MESKSYFMFPICFINADIDQLIDWCIVEVGKLAQPTDVKVCTQIMYGFYRTKDLPVQISKTIQGMAASGDLLLDDDSSGFSGDKFNPDFELDSLIKKLNSDTDFKQQAYEYYSVKIGKNTLNIRGGHFETTIKNHETMNKNYMHLQQKYGKMPHAKVSTDVIFEVRENTFEPELYRLLIAVKSLIGTKKDYVLTNKKAVVLRMFGCKNDSMLKELTPQLLAEYTLLLNSRKRFQTLIKKAVKRRFLLYLSHVGCRGFYLSTTIKNPLELAQKIQKSVKNESYVQAQNMLKSTMLNKKKVAFKN